MLSRKQRAEITAYVLKKIYPLCVKRENLFSEKDADDLMEDIGVHLWIRLIRYRRKPYNDAVKLAMTIANNRLTSIVRSRLTVRKRGAGATEIPFPGTTATDKRTQDKFHDPLWSMDAGIYGNGTRIIDAMELIVSAAIMRVGTKRADALIKALLYDWRKRKVTPSQQALMEILRRDRSGVRRLVRSFTQEMRKEITPSGQTSYPLHKVEGRWRNPLE